MHKDTSQQTAINWYWIALVFAIAVIAGWFSFRTEAVEPKSETQAPSTPAGVPLSEIAELQQIREQLGSPTDGTLFAEDVDTEGDNTSQDDDQGEVISFGSSLGKVMSREPATIHDPGTHKGPEAVVDRYSPPHPGPEYSVPAALQSAARLLETKAWDFDDTARHEEADELRRIAQQLREKARLK